MIFELKKWNESRSSSITLTKHGRMMDSKAQFKPGSNLRLMDQVRQLLRHTTLRIARNTFTANGSSASSRSQEAFRIPRNAKGRNRFLPEQLGYRPGLAVTHLKSSVQHLIILDRDVVVR
jgi:hypothetical protein